ncbi:ribosomal RNA-processing protein 7-domain-containing protein [Umbelopsis sp. AD052]|nr:ribosomal RNA-processing protein 7-domain-containing protein [Umbelopsis sp. AD052]
MPKDKTKSAKSAKKATSSGLQEFCGFKILPIHMNRDAVHYMYIKKHESRQDSEATPKDRTMFILNLPVDTTDEHIKRLFQPYGRVVSIKYHTRGNQPEEEEEGEAEEAVETAVDQPKLSRKQQQKLEEEEKQKKETDASLKIRSVLTTGSFAHVVLLEAKELENVLNMNAKKREWTEDDEAMLPLGFDRYKTMYALSHPSARELQSRVDSYIIKFQAAEYEKERIATEQQNKMDEDGFIMVTRHHRRGTNTDGEVTVTAAKADRQVKPQKKKELLNFYRFQMREQKRDQLVELRKKFEDDRKKIEQLKQTRKFRPY